MTVELEEDDLCMAVERRVGRIGHHEALHLLLLLAPANVNGNVSRREVSFT
jgi:hypothetical protein